MPHSFRFKNECCAYSFCKENECFSGWWLGGVFLKTRFLAEENNYWLVNIFFINVLIVLFISNFSSTYFNNQPFLAWLWNKQYSRVFSQAKRVSDFFLN